MMKKVQADLMEKGILIAYNPKYSDLGPKGGIRIAVFASHTRDDGATPQRICQCNERLTLS